MLIVYPKQHICCRHIFIGQPASTAITLYNDWNLVGYNGTGGAAIDATLPSSLAGKWVIIWGWESGVWKTNKSSGVTATVNVSELTTLEKGKAYWIKMNTAQPVDWLQ